jgi:hypothetical protein
MAPARRDGRAWQLDKPFWSLAVGPTGLAAGPQPDALSLNPRGPSNTILRNNSIGVARPLFDPPSAGASTSTTHPYMRKQLLTKIFNHLTTRSNVFAVWLTVGYFAVDDQGRLGAEIGKVENRQIRHRMFAIVDRSQMTVFKGTLNNQGGQPMTAGMQVTVTVPTLTDSRTGKTWTLAAGTALTLDEGQTNEETVLVQQVLNATTIRFTVRNAHAGTNVPVVCRGNPGPWNKTKYDPRQDTDVVPFFSVID